MEIEFSPAVDELLKDLVTSVNYRDLKPRRKWELIAKQFPGYSMRQLQLRWEKLNQLPGLEYRALAPKPGGGIPLGVKGSATGSVVAPTPTPMSRAGSAAASRMQRPLSRNSLTSESMQGSGSNLDAMEQLTLQSEEGDDIRSRTDSRASSTDAKEEPVIASNPNDDATIVIHVCDEARKVNRDFMCRKDLLLSEMRYFSSYLTGKNAYEDVDISVHCDVHIFEWLVRYIHNASDPPALAVNSVVSILISSDFLQMATLSSNCLDFIASHFNEIVTLPIDLGCINNDLVVALSDRFSDEQLEKVKDRKDKLLSKLYMRKIEMLMNDAKNQLYGCKYCRTVYTMSQSRWMVCPNGKALIDFHGNVISEHVPDSNFDVNDFLLNLRQRERLTWREVYWRLWGHLHALYCDICEQPFTVTHYGHCTYHPLEPIYPKAQQPNEGVYPCCDAPALLFGTGSPSSGRSGCLARNHLVKSAAGNDPICAALLERVHTHYALVTVPYARGGEDGGGGGADTGRESEDGGVEHEDDGEPTDSYDLDDDDDDDGDDDDSSAIDSSRTSSDEEIDGYRGQTYGQVASAAGSAVTGDDRNKTRRTSIPTAGKKAGHHNFATKHGRRRMKKRASSLMSKLSPKHRKQWQYDALKEDDRRRMRVLAQKLEQQRAPLVSEKDREKERSDALLRQQSMQVGTYPRIYAKMKASFMSKQTRPGSKAGNRPSSTK